MATATTRDGVTLDYELVGDTAAAKRVALVHSLAMDKEFWRPVADLLSVSGICSLIYDCRGHGKSDKPAGPYGAAQFSDDLADLLDGAGWDKAYVAGASMGGVVSIAFGQNHAARAQGLGLFDTTAWYGETAPKDWAGRAATAEKDGLAGLIAFQKTRWFSDAFRENNVAVVDECIDIFTRNDVPAYAASCNMLGNADLRAGLAAMKMPVRIAVGEEDYATPVPMSQALHDALAGSSMTVIKNGRHLTPLEVPEVIAGELRVLMGV
ncbi:MAG: alpha/beta hydrolase [Beijerinckiaceae bacterium]|jgi:3-oxoadipate enol-lactonase|nr:alpha/beta hydrolase [Beijerinckiaceae bacterium]